ncbi:MAG TPA: PDDEXK nuclease domain-containing protein [Coxiellaceae bacterium]|nr:PDDEXK nuclease domain-containing protein [Coxiellaceae bacterium]
MIDIQESGSIKKLHMDTQYQYLLNEIKTRLKKSQFRAAIAVNYELIQFYWEIGKLIITQQEKSKWGDALFKTLASDLRESFPNTEGFSETNLKSMRIFSEHYPDGEFGQALPAQLTWTHHVVIVRTIKPGNMAIKQWYANQTIENGWPYRELKAQIKSDLYNRKSNTAIKTTNFISKLPTTTSHLAQEMIKDPYKFHFLTVGNEALEKDIHNGLVSHIKEFLMELGHGFALYGTKYPINISKKRFEIDLLMYNTKLHAYVVIEIKRGEFHPKDTGQLSFYLTAVDEQLKLPGDAQTIGLLLCEKKDRFIAEYALKRIDGPMGITEYELSKFLPEKFESILPTTEAIEAELEEFTKEQ